MTTNKKAVKKKPIKKIIKRKKGKSKKYFTEKTQEAIVEYQNAETEKEKHKIYVERILPAFNDLVENLINVYSFKVLYDNKHDLKIECLEFLYTTVNKYDASKNSKAFSYFNVVAKNWLTIKSKQNAKKTKQYISLDNKETFSQSDLATIENYKILPAEDDILTHDEVRQILYNIVRALENRARTDNEKLVIRAIREIVDNLEETDLLSKRAVLKYIREITFLSPKQLSIVLSSLKKHYKELRKLDNYNYF